VRMQDLQALARMRPFQPFELLLTNGERYRVWHPDGVDYTLGSISIHSSEPADETPDSSSETIISLVHIVKITLLPIPRKVETSESSVE
jgi:hypothetical protein